MKWLCIGILAFIIIFIFCCFKVDKLDENDKMTIGILLVELLVLFGAITFWVLVFMALIKFIFH